MKLGILALMVGFAVLLVGGCGKSAVDRANKELAATPLTTATPDEFAFARANYAKDCSACHGQEGHGGLVKTTEGKMLKVPSLTEGHALKHDDADFVEQITKGGDGMPSFKGKLSPDEINTMVRFIRHEYQGK
jgi:mono/diheme cytochrome c family protein